MLVVNQEVQSRALFNHLFQYAYDYGNLLELVKAMANLVITSRIYVALSTVALGNLWLASPCMKETLTAAAMATLETKKTVSTQATCS